MSPRSECRTSAGGRGASARAARGGGTSAASAGSGVRSSSAWRARISATALLISAGPRGPTGGRSASRSVISAIRGLEAAQDGLDRGVGALLGLVVRFRELQLDALDRLQRGLERRTAAVRELALDLVETGGHRREGVAEHRGRVFLPLGGVARGGGEAVLGALDPARDRAQGGGGLGGLLAAAALGRLGGAGKKALEFLGRDAGGLAGKVRHRLELRDGGVELVRLLRPLALLGLAGLRGPGLGGLVGADGGEPFVERHAGVARRLARRLSGLRIEAVEPERRIAFRCRAHGRSCSPGWRLRLARLAPMAGFRRGRRMKRLRVA